MCWSYLVLIAGEETKRWRNWSKVWTKRYMNYISCFCNLVCRALLLKVGGSGKGKTPSNEVAVFFVVSTHQLEFASLSLLCEGRSISPYKSKRSPEIKVRARSPGSPIFPQLFKYLILTCLYFFETFRLSDTNRQD